MLSVLVELALTDLQGHVQGKPRIATRAKLKARLRPRLKMADQLATSLDRTYFADCSLTGSRLILTAGNQP